MSTSHVPEEIFRAGDVYCQGTGECEPCTAESPSCTPSGSRQSIKCVSLAPAGLAELNSDAQLREDEELEDNLVNRGAPAAALAFHDAHAVFYAMDTVVPDAALAAQLVSPQSSFSAFRVCAEAAPQDTRYFYDFCIVNVMLAGVALLVLYLRHQILAKQQYARLAARIGIPTEE